MNVSSQTYVSTITRFVKLSCITELHNKLTRKKEFVMLFLKYSYTSSFQNTFQMFHINCQNSLTYSCIASYNMSYFLGRKQELK